MACPCVPTDEQTVIYTLQAIAALRGCTATAELVEGFADDELTPRCPGRHCGVEVYVTIEDTEMFASLDDPATDTPSEQTPIEPPSSMPLVAGPVWTEDNAPGQLIALAELAGHPALAAKIRLATGQLRCPKCGEPFSLWETLLHPTDL